jgi:hypothetical protein
MSKASYSKRKKANAIPYDEISIARIKQQISLNWLFDNNALIPAVSASTIVGDNSINVNIGDGNQITIGAKDFADAGEAAEIVKNLRFAPKPYLDALLEKLRQFRDLAKA